MQEKQQHSKSAAGAAPNSNVLLSVDEILGLVVDDGHDDGHDEDPSPSPSPVSLFLRSDSLGETPVPMPPMPQRAQTWHAMPSNTRSRKVEANHRVYPKATASATNKNDDDYENTIKVDEVFQNARQFQRGPSRPSRTPSPDSTTDFGRNVHHPQQQYRPNIVESSFAPFPNRDSNRDSERNERVKMTARSSWPSYPPNGNNTKKKPTSRFEIFENKLREEEGIFGILL